MTMRPKVGIFEVFDVVFDIELPSLQGLNQVIKYKVSAA